MSDIIHNIFDYIASKNLEKEKNKGIGFNKKKYVDLSDKSREIDKMPPSELFIKVRNFAGEHIQNLINSNEECNWIKSEMTHPTFDHFNFRFKNQLFSILIDIRDSENNSFLPPEFIKRQLGESPKNNFIPCIFPVIIDSFENLSEMKTLTEGWNLFSTINQEAVNVEKLISDKKIEMSAWEFHNFAIMQIRYMLKQQNLKVVSFQDVVGVNPQVWFIDENGNKSWIVVRYGLDNKTELISSDDLAEITRRCFKFDGYLAKFVFHSKNNEDKKIYRGDTISVKFTGFEKIHTFM